MLGALPGLLLIPDPKNEGTAQTTPQLPSDKGALISVGTPQVPDDALAYLGEIHQVDSLPALESALGPDTTTILIDGSALPAVPPAFLKHQLSKGRSLIGLNVPLSELVAASGFVSAVQEDSDPRSTLEFPEVDKPAPDEPFYSFVNMTPDGSVVRRFSSGQRPFSSGLFGADLAHHLTGVNADLG